MTEDLLASQEELCSMQLVNIIIIVQFPCMSTLIRYRVLPQ